MSLFLSKKVENWCMGMVKVNKTDIIYTCVLEVILQLPYSHYMNPVSYEFTNKLKKCLLMHVLTTGEMARHVVHGIFACLATSVAKVPERSKHSIKQ